jgi:hypothetical protein
VVGYRDGTVEVAPATAGGRARFTLDQTPGSPVVRILSGPTATLFIGFESGFLGLWSRDTGARLDHLALHGPVKHLVIEGDRLYAASELGQHLALDLGVFHVGYCELLAEVRRAVPVLWEGGAAVVRPPAAGHRCPPH